MKNEMLVPEGKEKMPRQAKRTDDSHFDRIWKYYYNEKTTIQLSEHEEELKKRWEHIWMLLGNILTTARIIRLQKKKFKINESTAYRDLHNAKSLFGNPDGAVDKAKRAIVSEWLLKAMQKAYKAQEWKSFEKLILRYSRINGLDMQENEGLAEMLKKIRPHTIIISGDPSALKEEADALMENIPETKDINHVELDDGD